MRLYCTLFDQNYLPNFLALYNSLAEHSQSFKIYAFCMDNKTYDYLSDLNNHPNGKIVCVSLEMLKRQFVELQKIQEQRSVVEFYFTCSPFICTYVFLTESNADYVTYLDADLMFFHSPENIFREFDESSVAIIAHKFYGWGRKYLKYGIYNVGWVSFKNDQSGRDCLNQWKLDCTEWCYDYYDAIYQRFGDQKYLDKWSSLFNGVKVIDQKGANLAPWNAGQYRISVNKMHEIMVDNDRLIFYHFASFKKINESAYTTNLSRYMARPSKVLKEMVYKKYLDIVSEYALEISRKTADNNSNVMQKNRQVVHQTNLKQKFSQTFNNITRWYFGDYIHK